MILNFLGEENFTIEGPVLYASADDAPFLICHGDQDRAVPLSQGVSLEAALKKAGVPVELVVVKGGGHGFKPVKDGPPPVPSREEINAKVLAFLEKTLK
jgi:dipeptidyl aminopeptidase/acylaminoacyl peptidase